MERAHRPVLLALALLVLVAPARTRPTTDAGDAAAMREIARSLGADRALGWDPSEDPCGWDRVTCDTSGRVTAIQVGNRNLSGSVPSAVRNLTSLSRLELMENSISGPLPSLSGLSSLQTLLLHDNLFSSLPQDFFAGLSSLQVASLDRNPFSPSPIPSSLVDAVALVNFTASNTSVTGTIPDFLATAFPALNRLSLSYNLLEGPVPTAFASSPVRSLLLNSQKSRAGLSGGIEFVRNMTSIVQLWLHSNSFSGPLPDFSRLTSLQDLQLRDNRLTGPVPASLTSLNSLSHVTLTNNLLQGPVPVFGKGVQADVDPKGERFCLSSPGDCDPRVTTLLDIVSDFGYPTQLANAWRGNDPCASWLGITCAPDGGDINVVNFQRLGLNGTISPEFEKLLALQTLVLANNNISGTIPSELTTLTALKTLDVSHNNLWGKLPSFRLDVKVDVSANPNFGKDGPPAGTGDSGSSPSTAGTDASSGKSSSVSAGVIAGSVIAALGVACLIGVSVYCCYKKKRRHIGAGGIVKKPNNIVIHPQYSGSVGRTLKTAFDLPGSSNESKSTSKPSSQASNLVAAEGGNKMTIEALRKATNNFSDENILGRGGFGTVYLGVMNDGTEVAVKRMQSGAMGSNGMDEFKAEIDVLTKVRHRHLVSLLGHCWEGDEKLLVYEYMPQGTLSHHLHDWEKTGARPMEWKRRLSVALDVARGVEYLHGMAHQSFIHRDLKPSNILLGDDMRAKVADFGLVRLAPGGKYASVETKLAGTFGYLAPEYAQTGRVTTKADVYSFGVILLELITGRKALDDKRSDENAHLVTWFRRMNISKQTLDAVDPHVDRDEETLTSATKISELACHCCARDPYQRPDMGYAVNVLSSLVEQWSPSPTRPYYEDDYAIDLNMTLPEALAKWQALGDGTQLDGTGSSLPVNVDSTQSSIPTAPFSDPQHGEYTKTPKERGQAPPGRRAIAEGVG